MVRPTFFAASLGLAILLALAPTTGEAAAHRGQIEANDSDPFSMLLSRYVDLGSADEVSPEDAARLRGDLSALADTGDAQALNLLAILTEQGFGRPPNPDAGLGLFYLAAENGSADAALNLSVREIQSPDPVVRQAGLDRLDALARRSDLPETLAGLITGYQGWTLALGLREADNPDRTALDLIETGLAANPDDSILHWAMALLIETDGPAIADRARLLHHYRQAGRNGHGQAAWRAGMMHLNGDGTETDAAEAFRWINLAAGAGLDDGLISLAVMYAVGQGTDPDPVRARALYGEAASRGNAHALRGLGFMLIFGEGGEADPVRGVALARLAADAGDRMAADLLTQLAPQIPDEADWIMAVNNARAEFLRETGLSPDRLYGAQTLPAASPAVVSGGD
ncbi:tetratricopeptide repeat protein [Maricaulis sp.]|uniref:tetratricopeptide repeat protein n=1 Tax=Maricaulis sp. TaxID=1486257 RepID=UPI0025BD9AEA|nr:tetratricopeptide repeat protein [Maricaulis sp.]